MQPTCTGTCSPEQRTFQAVREKVLPAEPMRMQRSRMPGRLRMDTCLLPLNTRCSYTCRGEEPGVCQQALWHSTPSGLPLSALLAWPAGPRP